MIDIKEIKAKFPVGSPIRILLINLVEKGYFDFRITENRNKLFTGFLKDEVSFEALCEINLISNSKARQLITNSLGAVAQFVAKHHDELQKLYHNSLLNNAGKDQLQHYCYNISPYYQKMHNPVAPQQKNPFEPLQFSVKVANLLNKSDIKNVEDLCATNAGKLIGLHRMGAGTLNEIRTQLAKNHLKLKDE